MENNSKSRSRQRQRRRGAVCVFDAVRFCQRLDVTLKPVSSV